MAQSERLEGSHGDLSPAARALLERRSGSTGGIAAARVIERGCDSARPAPLSSWQQSIWFLDQMAPGSDMHNRAKKLRLTGALDLAALEASVAEIFRRHEVLRSRVVMASGGPAQVPMPEYEFSLPVIDLGELAPAERHAKYMEIEGAAARAPFDLVSGPWARAELVRESSDEHVLLFTAHHIAFDGWSTEILFAEMADFYRAFRASERPQRADLALQYADFARWQRAQLRSSALGADIDYWVAKLLGAPSLLELPTDRPRPGTESNVAGDASTVIEPAMVERLRAVGREENATLFMTLFAGFQLFLSRMCGQDDLVVGIQVAGRANPATEKMIGCFINVLPLRTRIDGERSFRDLLRDVRGTVLEGFTHQEAPFDAVVERSGAERSLAHGPITQVLFNFRNTHAAELAFAGLGAELDGVNSRDLFPDLEIEIEQRGDALHVIARYHAALFEGSTIRRWLGHYRTLLDGVIAAPGERVSRVPLLTAAERREIVVDWNLASTAPDYETCVHRLFEAQVRRTPDATAVFGAEGAMTYAELNRRANILARDLVARGVGPDVLVGINMERCLDLAPAVLGVLKAGGAYVPLDPEYPAERLEYMLSDSQPAVLLTGKSNAALAAGATPVIDVDAEYWASAPSGDGGNVANDATPDSLAYVIYTSGSTGWPKGAMNTHRAVCNLMLRSRDGVGFSSSDVALLRTPLSFDLSVKEFLVPLISGGRVALARARESAEPEYLAGAIESFGVTILFVVPTVLQLLLGVKGIGRRCASVRAVLCGGETLSNALLERHYSLLNRPLYNTFGPTETAVDALEWRCNPVDTHQSVPIGRPVANDRAYILDACGAPVPVGVTGEIYVGGVGVGRGYLNRPGLTAERFIPDPFSSVVGAKLYRTGDLGRYDADGVVEILGRADDQVKIRGIRIELGEIEAVLSSVEGVLECAVVKRDDAPGGPGLVAYVVAVAGVALDDRLLRAALSGRLLPAMVPSTFVTLDALPLTPSRKIDRRALPVPVVGGHGESSRQLAPTTPAEAMLASIWSEVLQRERVDVDDNFFELGGHSLSATRVMVRVRDRAGLDVPLRLLFEHPTVRALARCLDDLALSAHGDDEVRTLLAGIEGEARVRDTDPA